MTASWKYRCVLRKASGLAIIRHPFSGLFPISCAQSLLFFVVAAELAAAMFSFFSCFPFSSSSSSSARASSVDLYDCISCALKDRQSSPPMANVSSSSSIFPPPLPSVSSPSLAFRTNDSFSLTPPLLPLPLSLSLPLPLVLRDVAVVVAANPVVVVVVVVVVAWTPRSGDGHHERRDKHIKLIFGMTSLSLSLSLSLSSLSRALLLCRSRRLSLLSLFPM